MDERIVKFRVGVVVVATLIILALLVMMFNNFGSLLRGRYTIHVHFPEAPGVAVNTPVRKDRHPDRPMSPGCALPTMIPLPSRSRRA